MDISNYINPIAGSVGILVSVMTILLTYQNLKAFKGDKAKELHSCYAAIKALSVDMTTNYPEILILLNRITNAELNIKEVEWFVNEPGAFLKLEQYGRIYGRYCEINIEKGEFALTERVSTFKKRSIERFKIVSFGLAMFIFLSVVWAIIIYFARSEGVLYLALSFCFLYFLVIFWGINLLWGTISKSVDLEGKPLKRKVNIPSSK